ncbi:pyridoxamine 5'-phosphate oxidase family protein [uncultured Dysosmobacter sp.]|uniref:pyridoxamine 5'-phosphate oxidase family protein n=1 Tax=uncultured Dysosmobacter sp. TaxID=2591384 RepID=UPI002631585A|nr:pyridoxamine 5'-phosphate oxidase family protein [uncultured Dysosmobacter sp.]
MLRYEQFVYDPAVISAILDQCEIVHIGFQDRRNAYVVPMCYGYTATEENLLIFIHTAKEGYMLKLIEKSPLVCCSFAAWRNFPDRPYKGHVHDYRSVMAFGRIRKMDLDAEPEACDAALQALFCKTHRKDCKNPKGIAGMNMYMITCDWQDVSGKTETPVRCPEDVPFPDVYGVPEDNTPYDITDLLSERPDEIRNKRYLGYLDD